MKKATPHYEEALISKEKVEHQLEMKRVRLNLTKPLASIKVNASLLTPRITIAYNFQDLKEIEEIVRKLIDDYNEKIHALPSDQSLRSLEENDTALKSIAELFQNLEWLHPFHDGQGRTDLVLLAKLLVENGFNPSILYFPYYSSFEPLENWISYLKAGMEAWRMEKMNNEM